MKVLALLLFAVAVTSAAEVAEVEAAFGERLSYEKRELCYPGFRVRFKSREEHRPAGTVIRAVTYTFEVIGAKEVKASRLVFTMSGVFDNVATFEMDGKSYAAEMFYTTAGQPLVPEIPPKQNGEMKHDEIIVWDEAAARIGNFQIIERFERKANQ